MNDTATDTWAFAQPDTDLHAYLVIDGEGGEPWAGLDRDRAHDYARNIGAVVVKVPVVGDYRAEGNPR